MLSRIIALSLITASFSFVFVGNSVAQAKQRPPQKAGATAPHRPLLTKPQSNRAINQLRSARNSLHKAQKFSSQKHKSAKRSLDRAKETERAMRDVHEGRLANAARRQQSGARLTQEQLTRISQADRVARLQLRTATTQRANAELVVSQTRSELTTARRQLSAANKRLSLAKKGDWIGAHNVTGGIRVPLGNPKGRKITFGETTYSGDGRPPVRKGKFRLPPS